MKASPDTAWENGAYVIFLLYFCDKIVPEVIILEPI